MRYPAAGYMFMPYSMLILSLLKPHVDYLPALLSTARRTPLCAIVPPCGRWEDVNIVVV